MSFAGLTDTVARSVECYDAGFVQQRAPLQAQRQFQMALGLLLVLAAGVAALCASNAYDPRVGEARGYDTSFAGSLTPWHVEKDAK